MALVKEVKTELVKNFQKHEKDTGSPEVQIAILTNRITYLTEHFKLHKKDRLLEDAIGQLKCVYYLVRQNGQWYLQDASSEPVEKAKPTKVVNKKPEQATK